MSEVHDRKKGRTEDKILKGKREETLFIMTLKDDSTI